MVIQFVVAVIGTLAFAILFDAPPRHYLVCAFIGGAGWAIYLCVRQMSASPALACFTAALLLTSMARLASFVRKAPVIVFLTAGIFPLVPGAAIYFTAYYLFSRDMGMAGAKAMETLITSGTLALGILFGSAVPAKVFELTALLFKKPPKA